MSCGLLDLKCHAQGLLTGWLGEVTAWVDGVFPFGWYGVWFIAGVIVGERFGKWAYAAIAAFILYRVFGREKSAGPVTEVDDEDPKPFRRQKPPSGKRVRTIFDMFQRKP